MIGVAIVTHGNLGLELLRTAESILGHSDQVIGFSLERTQDESVLMEQVRRTLSSVDSGDGVLALVDMLGGTPSNLCLRLVPLQKIEVLTGVNLPMVLKALSRRQLALRDLAQAVQEAGTRNIVLASELVRGI